MPVSLPRLLRSVGAVPSGSFVRKRGSAPVVVAEGARRLTSAFWTQPLEENAPLAATSVVWSKRLADQATSMISGTPFTSAYTGVYGTRTSTDAYSINVYEVPVDTPRVPVWATSDKYYTSGGVRTSFRDVLDAGVPLPNPALLSGNRIQPSGTDGSIIIVCGLEAWELWRFAPTTTVAGYGWQCSQGGYIADTTTHPGWWAGSGNENAPARGGDFGVSASGMAYLGAILTGADFYAADITHPLAVALPETGGYGTADFPYFVFPATRGDRLGALRAAADGTLGDTVKVPEGARFRLPAAQWTNSAITAYAAANGKATAGPNGSTAATLAKVMRALRDYGMLVSDFAQIVGFSAEADTTYGTPYNPLSAAQRPVWGNFGQQLPWSSFVQVAPPSSTVAVQGWGTTSATTPTGGAGTTAPTVAANVPSAVGVPARGFWSGGSGVGIDGSSTAFATWRGDPVDYKSTWIDSADGAAWTGGVGAANDTTSPVAGFTGMVNIAIGGPSNWQTAAGGSLDGQVTALARRLRTNRTIGGVVRPTIIRAAHEWNNASGYAWKVPDAATGGYAKTTLANWGRIFKTEFPEAMWELCQNGENVSTTVRPRDLWTAGVHTILGADRYNQYQHIGTDATGTFRSFASESGKGSTDLPIGLYQHLALAGELGVPLDLPEYASNMYDTGTPSNAGESVYYWGEFYAWVQANQGAGAGKVFSESLFNQIKDSNRWILFRTDGVAIVNPADATKYQALHQAMPR